MRVGVTTPVLSLLPRAHAQWDEFEGRGARGDDAIRALRASLGQREPVYRGTHYSYEGFIVEPCAIQTRMPIWIGGRTARSLRRAIELADGWVPFGLSPEQIGG